MKYFKLRETRAFRSVNVWSNLNPLRDGKVTLFWFRMRCRF